MDNRLAAAFNTSGKEEIPAHSQFASREMRSPEFLGRALRLWLPAWGLILTLLACSPDKTTVFPEATVYLTEAEGGYRLMRRGEEFVIRGVAGHEHLAKLKSIGGNTIRVYDTNGLGKILDSANAYDLAVIAGVWMMGKSEMDYTDSFMVAQQFQETREVIRRYRDHPALLMWCIGNEITYRASFSELWRPEPVWQAFAELVDMVKEEDPNHPVTTTITNYQRKRLLYFKFRVPKLDLVGINTFGRIEGLRQDASRYGWFFDMPFFLAEWAIPGPWECETTEWYTPIEPGSTEKALEYKRYYQEYIPHHDPRFLGSCAFYWGYKQEHTHTWFSLFSENGQPTAAVSALKACWQGINAGNQVPEVDSLLINGQSAADNLVVYPGQRLKADLFASDPEGDEMITQWELLPDQWHFDYRAVNRKPKPLSGYILRMDHQKLHMKAPEEEGAYRLFARVSDSVSGGVSYINTCFLVTQ